MQAWETKNMLITGASGLVGKPLQKRLRELGHQVFCLKREPTRTSAFSWQPDQNQLWLDPSTKLDIVIHLAGAGISEKRWSKKIKKEILQSRVLGTELLCSTLLSRPVKPELLISASAIGFYGNSGSTPVDESAANGEGFLAEVARSWENAAQAAVTAGIRTVFLRSGVVLSSQGGLLQRMLTPFKLGLGGKIGDGRQYLSWVSITDLLNIIIATIENTSLSGPVNAVSPNPVTNQDFTKQLAKHLHRPQLLPLPQWLAKLAFGEMADELLLAGQAVEPTKLLDSNFQFTHKNLKRALESLLP